MTILERVQADSRQSLKAGDRQRTSALRLLIAALQTALKDGREDELRVLQRERKHRLEAAEMYQNAGRDEHATNELFEVLLLESYLPEPLGPEQLRDLVEQAIGEVGAAGPRDMGAVMSWLRPRTIGRAEGKPVAALVRNTLS